MTADACKRAYVVDGFPKIGEFRDQGFIDDFRPFDDRPARKRIKQIAVAFRQPFIIGKTGA